MSTRHRWIHPDHQEVVDRLEEHYADQGLRFDTGFAGSIPVQASGRIGRRYFYFRFRGDTASLTIGSPNRHRDASYAKRNRIHALRKVRRFKGDDLMNRFWAEHGLKPTLHLDRHPSIAKRYAVIHDVTGEQYNGTLEQDEAEQLFVRLMGELQAVTGRETPGRIVRAVIRGRRTVPMRTSRHVIRKPSRTVR